jgi:hypothetical protein
MGHTDLGKPELIERRPKAQQRSNVGAGLPANTECQPTHLQLKHIFDLR